MVAIVSVLLYPSWQETKDCSFQILFHNIFLFPSTSQFAYVISVFLSLLPSFFYLSCHRFSISPAIVFLPLPYYQTSLSPLMLLAFSLFPSPLVLQVSSAKPTRRQPLVRSVQWRGACATTPSTSTASPAGSRPDKSVPLTTENGSFTSMCRLVVICSVNGSPPPEVVGMVVCMNICYRCVMGDYGYVEGS